MIADVPYDLAAHIENLLGPDPEVTAPGGMSGACVVRLKGHRGSAILKQSGSPREWHVYTTLVPLLRAAGVDLPRLLGDEVVDGLHWLLLEDIEQPLPRERWLADHAVIGILRRLHEIPLEAVELHPEAYRPAWPAGMSEQALSLFDDETAARIGPALDGMRAASGPLFKPLCLISGDPNPANWGVREDGGPVLFDWERLTVGCPAIDLAITVPGLGSPDDFRQLAEVYLGIADDEQVDRLTSGMSVAKVWSVMELLASCATGDVTTSFPLGSLLDAIPDWLETLPEPA